MFLWVKCCQIKRKFVGEAPKSREKRFTFNIFSSKRAFLEFSWFAVMFHRFISTQVLFLLSLAMLQHKKSEQRYHLFLDHIKFHFRIASDSPINSKCRTAREWQTVIIIGYFPFRSKHADLVELVETICHLFRLFSTCSRKNLTQNHFTMLRERLKESLRSKKQQITHEVL